MILFLKRRQQKIEEMGVEPKTGEREKKLPLAAIVWFISVRWRASYILHYCP